MNISTHSVSVGETDIKLTKTEYAISKQLMINPTQVVTKSQLLDLIRYLFCTFYKVSHTESCVLRKDCFRQTKDRKD